MTEAENSSSWLHWLPFRSSCLTLQCHSLLCIFKAHTPSYLHCNIGTLTLFHSLLLIEPRYLAFSSFLHWNISSPVMGFFGLSSLEYSERISAYSDDLLREEEISKNATSLRLEISHRRWD
jgi:hypothetical protein